MSIGDFKDMVSAMVGSQPSPARSDKDADRLDAALATFLAEHTRLSQDGIDEHAARMALALNHAANKPVPEADIAEWYEQGLIEASMAERAPSSEEIATWDERQRASEYGRNAESCMLDEIADLRAALARRATAGTTTAQAQSFDAAAFIEKRAADYLHDNASTEHETGATIWHYGEAGHSYHSGLVELAEEIRALAGNAAPTEADCHPTCGYIGADCNYPACKMSFASNAATAAPGNAEILRTALLAAREMVGHPDNVAAIDKALADASAAPGDLPPKTWQDAPFSTANLADAWACGWEAAREYLASNAAAAPSDLTARLRLAVKYNDSIDHADVLALADAADRLVGNAAPALDALYVLRDYAEDKNNAELHNIVTAAIRASHVASNAGAAQQPLMRQAVASVVSHGNGEYRVGWLRPERVQVGSLLYCIDRAAPSNPPVGAHERKAP